MPQASAPVASPALRGTGGTPLRQATQRATAMPPFLEQAEQDAGALPIAEAVASIWVDIEASLAPVIGRRGMAALYLRSLQLTTTAHPWLPLPEEGAERFDLSALQAAVGRQVSAEALRGSSTLLHTFCELLGSLVGEPLATRLLGPYGVGTPETPELAHGEAPRDASREATEQLLLSALSAQAAQAAAEQAQARQMAVLTIVAHELRNPLAPLRIAAALMLKGHPDDTRLQHLQASILRQVAHMARLVSDLLDVSRAKVGKLRVERQVVHMASLIEEAVEGCRPAMDARSHQLTVSVPAGALQVNGDPVRLMQVLCNLLDNASKYTPVGGQIALSVTASATAMVLTVTDNGIGITAEALPRVFEPFVQDPHAVGFNGAGLGIGLTVVQELVTAHGGQVVATSAGKDAGSQFSVTLPLLLD